MYSISIAEAARIVGKSPRPLQIKAKKEEWQGIRVEGTKYCRYPLAYYPADWQEAIISSLPKETIAALGGNPVNALPEAVFTEESPRLVTQLSTDIYSETVDGIDIADNCPLDRHDAAGVGDLGYSAERNDGVLAFALPQFEPPAGRRDRAGEAKNLILLAKEFYLSQQKAVEQGRVQHFTLEFVSLYKEQRIALPLWVYEAVKGLSYQTIYRWEGQRAVGGVSALKRKSFEREKTMDANAEMAEFAKNLLLSFPHLNPKAIWKEVQQRYPEQCPSLPTMRRWIAEWISQHQGAFEYAQSPKDHRSGRQRAFGSYAVSAYNERWEFDSTLSDIIWELRDETGGFRRFALVGAVEVYSRLAKVLVARTSNSEAIASLMRECLLDWGVPLAIKTDNGKDYLSRHVVNILSNLHIQHKHCLPFHPQQKPYIERFWKTLNHSSEMLSHPRYLGHNVVTREKIRAREWWKESGRKKEGDKEVEVIRLNLTLREFQAFIDQWIADYSNRPHEGLPKIRDAQGNLRHLSPNERAAGCQRKEISDVRALDVLMLPAAGNGGYRSAIRKEGIQVGNLENGDRAYYWHPCLVSVAERFEKVYVRCDPNPAYVHIFDSEDCTEYLGRLECFQISGNDPMPGIMKTRAAEKEQRKLVSAARMATKRLEHQSDKFREAREGAGEVVLLRGQGEVHSTPALEAAAKAEVSPTVDFPALRPVSVEPEVVPVQPEPEPVKRLEEMVVIPRVVAAWRQGTAVDPAEVQFIGRLIKLNRGGVHLMKLECQTSEDFWAFKNWVEETLEILKGGDVQAV